MRTRKYKIKLSTEEQKQLEGIIKKGKHPAREIRRANILLQLNGEKPLKEVAESSHCGLATVYKVSKQYVEEGMGAVLKRKRRTVPPVPAKVNGDEEAKIIALSCSEPPEGYGKWTVRLLSERIVALEIMPSISYSTVWRVLKETH
jgi:transposase